jgi:RNA polymerase sigma factor (TIGR02999 family)
MAEHAPTDKRNPDLGSLLVRVDNGEPGAFGELVEAVYPELKRLARYHLQSERPGHTLNTTAIVHEAYLRMAGNNPSWQNKGHFLRASSKVMRHLLVDHARKRNAAKRGGGEKALTLEEQLLPGSDNSMALIALDDAIKDMKAVDSTLEGVVECRIFASLSVPETAEALDVSERTVRRRWEYARAYLLDSIDNEPK